MGKRKPTKLQVQPDHKAVQDWLASSPLFAPSVEQIAKDQLKDLPKLLEAADLFCGAGGFSEGLRRRLLKAGIQLHLACVNHWQTAVDTHKLMHPYADHVVDDVGNVHPLEMVKKGKLHLLLASPPCQYHSLAGGARPMHEQGRMHPWLINRWLTDLYVERCIFENVPAFIDWGPICGFLEDHAGKHIACAGPDPEPHCGEEFSRQAYFQIIDFAKEQKLRRKLLRQGRKHGCPLPPDHDGPHDYTRPLPPQPCGRPVPERKGEHFQAWIASLWMLGYQVEWKILNAADFGGATTRKRLFIQCRRDGKPTRWPERTHAPAHIAARPRLDGKKLLPYRTAREIIDWSDEGESIFLRDRPLSENTRLRMARGLQRFGGPLAPLYIALLELPEKEAAAYYKPESWAPEQRPFVFANRSHNEARDGTYPIPAITTTTGGGVMLVTPNAEPFILPQNTTNGAVGVNGHGVPTVTTTSRGIGLFKPEAVQIPQHAGGIARSVDEGVPTVTGDGHAIARPMILPYHQQSECYPTTEPLKTVGTKDDYALVQPEARATVGTPDALVVPYGPEAQARSVDQPTHTIPTKDRLGLAQPTVEPFLVNYHGDDADGRPRAPQGTDEPLSTMHAGGKSHALVQPTSEPFMVPHWNGREDQAPRIHSIDEPGPTVTSRGMGNLVQPVVMQADNMSDAQGRRGPGVRGPDDPLFTVTTNARQGLVQPVLIQTDQTGGHGDYVRSVDTPLPTQPTKQNLGLTTPELLQPELQAYVPGMDVDPRRLVLIDGTLHVLDIKYRMLKNPELARAMGFDDDEYTYEFTGSQSEITKQIGNAVEVHTAIALVGAALYDLLPQEMEAVA